MADAVDLVVADDEKLSGPVAVDKAGRVILGTTSASLGTPTTPAVVSIAPATTATLANVAGSATSVTLQAANTARKGLVIVNDSASDVRVKFGSGASSTSFTYWVYAGQTLELPSNGTALYTGIVTGIWDTAVGSARMTELT